MARLILETPFIMKAGIQLRISELILGLYKDLTVIRLCTALIYYNLVFPIPRNCRMTEHLQMHCM